MNLPKRFRISSIFFFATLVSAAVAQAPIFENDTVAVDTEDESIVEAAVSFVPSGANGFAVIGAIAGMAILIRTSDRRYS